MFTSGDRVPWLLEMVISGSIKFENYGGIKFENLLWFSNIIRET